MGHPHTDEVKRRISEAKKAYWAARGEAGRKQAGAWMHSPEANATRSRNMAIPENKERAYAGRRALWSSPEWLAAHRERMQDPALRKRQSESALKRIARGEGTGVAHLFAGDTRIKALERATLSKRTASFQRGWSYRGIAMRSSWEVAAATWFDQQGLVWEYEPRTFRVTVNGKKTIYTPDFRVLIPGVGECWVEVKGWRGGATKFIAWHEQYPELRKAILFEEEIKAIKAMIS